MNDFGQSKLDDEIANEYGMKTNEIEFIKYLKLIAVILTEWLDYPHSLSSFGSFKEYVPQLLYD